jgi:hypothetical protein
LWLAPNRHCAQGPLRPALVRFSYYDSTMTVTDDGYQRHSYLDLVAAAECGEPSAVEALKEFIRLKTAERAVVIERHPCHGWRVCEPFASE